MAARLNKEFPDHGIELVKGDKGIFDVSVDDKIVYSKDERGISLSDMSEDEIVEIVSELNKTS